MVFQTPIFNNPNLSLKKFSNLFLVIIGIFAFAVTLLKSYTMILSYDEADTYLNYARLGVKGVFKIHHANNHILNTFLTFLSSYLFPFNELFIRLPNLIFCALYFLVSFLISKNFKNYLIVFSLLTLNFFLSDFFARTRGYGMAATLVLIALYILKNKNHFKNYFVIVLYTMLLACYANFIALTIFIATITTISIQEITVNGLPFIKKHLVHLIIVAINLLYMVYVFSQVTGEGKPLFGAYSTTFSHAIIGNLYSKHFKLGAITPKISLLIVSLLILIVIFLMIKHFKVMLFTKITLLNFLLIYITAKILNKPYPTQSLLLPYWPLLVITLG